MYTKDILSNGIRIVMESMPYVNSVSIGIWVESGSKNEDKHINGISHLIEHLLFKGTINRTSKEIAEAIDDIGGQINAFTTKEYTCFYVNVLDEHIDIAIDVLSDMLKNSLFSEEDIIKEKNVIYEEIKMYQDSPEDLVYDLLSEGMFENTSLAMPILGTIESLNNIDREVLIDYYKTYYTPKNMVVSIAGNIKNEETIKLLEYNFGNLKGNSMENVLDKSNDNHIYRAVKFVYRNGRYTHWKR